jgi:hypothetical protein
VKDEEKLLQRKRPRRRKAPSSDSGLRIVKGTGLAVLILFRTMGAKPLWIRTDARVRRDGVPRPWRIPHPTFPHGGSRGGDVLVVGRGKHDPASSLEGPYDREGDDPGQPTGGHRFIRLYLGRRTLASTPTRMRLPPETEGTSDGSLGSWRRTHCRRDWGDLLRHVRFR